MISLKFNRIHKIIPLLLLFIHSIITQAQNFDNEITYQLLDSNALVDAGQTQ